MIRYLFLLHVCLIGFYGLYRWRLHRLPDFRLNRLYLLLVPVLCMLLPLLRLPVPPAVNDELIAISQEYWEPLQSEWQATPVGSDAFPFDATAFLLGMYGLGMVGQFMRSGLFWYQAKRLTSLSPYARRGQIRWCKHLPFSFAFFGRIYLGQDYQALALKERHFLLRHEAVHARLGHSWDVLWFTLFRTVAWCNPFAWKLLQSAQSIHEFQADRAAVSDPQDFLAYTRLLLTLQHKAQRLPVMNFHSHPLKERIMMLKQNLPQNSARRGAYLLSLPLLAILLSMSTFRMEDVAQHVPLPEPVIQSLTQITQEGSELPTLKPVQSDIVSGFGMRIHPVFKENKMHRGIDFAAPMGTPVKAAGRGTVKDIQHLPETYGNLLTIDHGNGYLSRYAQLSAIKVEVGGTVQQGEVVALSGNSGLSTVPHLHFEILYKNDFIDPVKILK